MRTQLMRKSSIKEFTYSVIRSCEILTLVERVHFSDGRTLLKCLGRYLGEIRLPKNGKRETMIREKLAEMEDMHGCDVKYVMGFESPKPFMKSSGEFCFFYEPESSHRDEFAGFKMDWTKLQRALGSWGGVF